MPALSGGRTGGDFDAGTVGAIGSGAGACVRSTNGSHGSSNSPAGPVRTRSADGRRAGEVLIASLLRRQCDALCAAGSMLIWSPACFPFGRARYNWRWRATDLRQQSTSQCVAYCAQQRLNSMGDTWSLRQGKPRRRSATHPATSQAASAPKKIIMIGRGVYARGLSMMVRSTPRSVLLSRPVGAFGCVCQSPR